MGQGLPVADQLIDRVVPDDLDWRDLVCEYPTVAVGVAVVGGFLLGWSHGERIVAALSEAASERVNETVDRFVDLGHQR